GGQDLVAQEAEHGLRLFCLLVGFLRALLGDSLLSLGRLGRLLRVLCLVRRLRLGRQGAIRLLLGLHLGGLGMASLAFRFEFLLEGLLRTLSGELLLPLGLPSRLLGVLGLVPCLRLGRGGAVRLLVGLRLGGAGTASLADSVEPQPAK